MRFLDGTLSLADVSMASEGYQRRQWAQLRAMALQACWLLSPWVKKGKAAPTPDRLIGRAPWDRRKTSRRETD